MYWNAGECREEWAGISINRNMRCIEIVARRLLARPYDRLIETWDVLKLILCPQFCCQNMINRNMRCIEISVLCRQAAGSGRINRNMRCIEMQRTRIRRHVGKWLIETWDVLKFIYPVWLCTPISRLIETWDVLKSGAESIAKGAQGD